VQECIVQEASTIYFTIYFNYEVTFAKSKMGHRAYHGIHNPWHGSHHGEYRHWNTIANNI